jgi:transcriptional regulator with XRE-family HTH domain
MFHGNHELSPRDKKRMITGPQVRAARGLLDWGADTLAEKAGLSVDTVRNIEKGRVQGHSSSLDKIIQTFSAYEVEFLPDEGVKKKSDSIAKLEGFKDFKFYMDQVYEAALQPYSCGGSKPICICNLDNSLFRKYLKDYYPVHAERLKKIQGLKILSLAAAEDKGSYPGTSYLEYRYLKGLKAVVAPFYVFGDNFALIDFDVQNPPKILLIHSPSLAQSYRDQFYVMWKNAAVKPPRGTNDTNKED